jgi:transcriptional regulator with XRE-family HTH domain
MEEQAFWSVPDRCLLGTKITLRRRELGLTVEELAARVGVPVRVVHWWELHVPRRAGGDAAWEAALEVTKGWLRSSIDRDGLAIARQAIRNIDALEGLAGRTRTRREFLGLTIDDLSDMTAIHPAVLADFENSPPESTHLDDTIENALSLPRGWIRGHHVRARREFLGLTIDDLSARTGLRPAFLSGYECSAPGPTEIDRLIEIALLLPPGAICGHDPGSYAAGAPLLPSGGWSNAVDDIRAICSRLVVHRSVGPGKVDLEAKLRMTLQRYGIYGDTNTSYAAIAKKFRISEQRVQQIVTETMAAAHCSRIRSSALQALSLALRTLLPARVSALDEHFRSLLGPILSLESANRFASDFLGNPLFCESDGTAFPLQDKQEREVVASPAEELLQMVSPVASAMARRAGAAQVRAVAQVTAAERGVTVSPAQVELLLRTRNKDFEWIDQTEGWFWFGPGHVSTPRDWILKMLLVAKHPLTLDEILSGLSRGKMRSADRYKAGATPAPNHILQQIIERSPEIAQSGSRGFRMKHGYASTLFDLVSAPERLIVDQFRRRGGVATRAGLAADLVDGGLMTRLSFHGALFGSPLFRPLGGQGWALVGVSP